MTPLLLLLSLAAPSSADPNAARLPLAAPSDRLVWPLHGLALACAYPMTPKPSDKLPIAVRPADKPLVSAVRAAILSYEDARTRAYAAHGRILAVLHGNGCKSINDAFSALIKAHEAAFAQRKAKDLDRYPESYLAWVPFKETRREPAPPPAGHPHYGDLCKAPDPAGVEQVPVVDEGLPEPLKKDLAELTADTRALNEAVVALRAASAEMQKLEQGFGCRETSEAYDQLRWARRSAFEDRMNEGLARSILRTLRWQAP